MKGVPPRCIAHAGQQLMSPPKERAAAEFILSLADHGFPYELVSHNVPQCCIFNMDKKGGTVGEVNWTKVLVQKSTRPILIQGAFSSLRALNNEIYNNSDGNQENITIVECIGANGTAIRPTYIFKGKYVLSKWKDNNPLHANFTDVFDAETHEKAAGLPRLLIWDGHVSHMSYEAAVYAWENNITLFCLPPHSTALLQPLNKVAFGPLSKALSEEIEKASITGQPAQKEDFPRLYAAARQEALTPKTILKLFEATGAGFHSIQMN
ncbi:DDE superfamily endonuclease [Rhizoctonia solani]|uniref:DDE superfamily endonuclease n=1 Tax=Rhizoctonia solani TaxID=456999 RepID=A0A8H7I518_9AGAM|nr:DDE superfamily endonuclease [Rhizoctonia solani]